MRVLFVITVRGHGRGGHFHSLNHISAAIGEELNVGIISIGTGNSDIIENNNHFLKHIVFTGKNYFSFKKEVNSFLSNYKPNVLHFFDGDSYNILSLALALKKYRVVVNKCGGPNPISFPYIKNLILFSEENKKWFRQNKKFTDTYISVIPNRVRKDEIKIGKIKRPITKKEDFCFVHIARIGKSYQNSIEKSILLIHNIKTASINNVHLYIIGVIEDLNVYSKLESQSKELPVSFLTEDEYTNKASNMLYLADAVIATGRGIMEATALGKPILTPAQNSDIPILVDSNNFKTFSATNFSPRNIASNKNVVINFKKISNLIQNDVYFEELEQYSEYVFDEYFNVEGGVEKYLQIYNKMSDEREVKNPVFRNIKYQLKILYSFLRYAK